jgi:hypothetical protein
MEVALVLLYVVVGVCGVSCIGIGIIAFMDWRQDRNWRKSRESIIEEAISSNNENYDAAEHYSNILDLEENKDKRDSFNSQYEEIRSGKFEDYITVGDGKVKND